MRIHLRQAIIRSYPSGRAGAGLLILRVAIAMAVVTHTASLLTIATAILLALGILSPLVALLAAVLSLVPPDTSPTSAAILVALLLLGPGAFSLDARLFGRREIIIPLPQSGYAKNARSRDPE